MDGASGGGKRVGIEAKGLRRVTASIPVWTAPRHPREPARGRGRQGPCHEQRPRLHAGDQRRPARTPAAGAIGPPSRACLEVRAPDPERTPNRLTAVSTRCPHADALTPSIRDRIRCRRGAVPASGCPPQAGYGQLDTGQNSCRSPARVVDAEHARLAEDLRAAAIRIPLAEDRHEQRNAGRSRHGDARTRRRSPAHVDRGRMARFPIRGRTPALEQGRTLAPRSTRTPGPSPRSAPLAPS